MISWWTWWDFPSPSFVPPKEPRSPELAPPSPGLLLFPWWRNRIDDGAYEMSPTFKWQPQKLAGIADMTLYRGVSGHNGASASTPRAQICPFCRDPLWEVWRHERKMPWRMPGSASTAFWRIPIRSFSPLWLGTFETCVLRRGCLRDLP